MLEHLKAQTAYIFQELLPHVSYDKRLTAELRELKKLVNSIETATFTQPEDETKQE